MSQATAQAAQDEPETNPFAPIALDQKQEAAWDATAAGPQSR